MFLSRNKKKNAYPWKPVLLYKSVVKGDQNYIGMFSWCTSSTLSAGQKKKKKKKKKKNFLKDVESKVDAKLGVLA